MTENFRHGRKEVFSCRGIRECVEFFGKRGHTDIIVFVPQFRRETARSDCPITDQHILFELEKENILVSAFSFFLPFNDGSVERCLRCYLTLEFQVIVKESSLLLSSSNFSPSIILKISKKYK